MDNFNNHLYEQRLTKRERRLLRKQQRKQEGLLLARRKKIKKMLFIFLLIALIAGGIIFALLNYSPSENQAENQGTPKMEINPKEYDAGTVSMSAGKIQRTYEIKSIGDGDLEIDSVWTSCHCTTARLKVGDKTSPEFGMDKRRTSQKIAPGETGFLEVTFDPAFHGPQGVGQAVRVVYLSTNDPENKKAEVRLLANVIQ